MKINSKETNFILALLCIVVIGTTSCVKEDNDFLKKETPESTIIQGSLYTCNNQPINGVEVLVDYHESQWLAYYKTKHKAKTSSDKTGSYRLFFNINDSEIDNNSESSLQKGFQLIYNLSMLDENKYILPNELDIQKFNGENYFSKTSDNNMYTNLNPEKSNTYTYNVYIPQKRLIKVTLKNFVPNVVSNEPYLSNRFSLEVNFPYGLKNCIGCCKIELSDKTEESFMVPFALNETNTLIFTRTDNRISKEEEITVNVTDSTPAQLVYSF